MNFNRGMRAGGPATFQGMANQVPEIERWQHERHPFFPLDGRSGICGRCRYHQSNTIHRENKTSTAAFTR